MSPEDALARRRYFAISVIRLTGVLLVMGGFILIVGRWSSGSPGIDRVAGVLLVLTGLFDIALFPRILARRWRSPGP